MKSIIIGIFAAFLYLLPVGACGQVLSVTSPTLKKSATPLELGVKFTTTDILWLYSVRFYKAQDTFRYTIRVYDSAGAKLGETTLWDNGVAGWRTVNLPIYLKKNKTYVVSYFSASGNYYSVPSYFTAKQQYTMFSFPVNAGVYKYSGGFPNTATNNNYLVEPLLLKVYRDTLFQPINVKDTVFISSKEFYNDTTIGAQNFSLKFTLPWNRTLRFIRSKTWYMEEYDPKTDTWKRVTN